MKAAGRLKQARPVLPSGYMGREPNYTTHSQTHVLPGSVCSITGHVPFFASKEGR